MEKEKKTAFKRLRSLDALRGFDMFWIAGGAAIFLGLGKAFPGPGFDKFLEQFDHVPWQGLHFFDLIWPLFMFIMGVAIPFSVARRRDEGSSDRSILIHAAKRAAIMFLLGTVTQGNLLLFDLSKFRPCYSVLHGLAAGYLIATIVVLKVKSEWHPATIGIFLLVYWAIIMFVPVPGVGAGVLTPDGNIATYVDQLILGRFHFGENTWFLSYLGFGSSVLLGVLAGHILIDTDDSPDKIFRLLVLGSVYLLAGILWSLFFPVIKLLWTSSFVLIGGGLSFFTMTLFYWIIDVHGYRKWAFIFTVIGMNSLAVYLAISVFDFSKISNVFVGNLLPLLGQWASLTSALATFAVIWSILYWMYLKKEFIRI
jgi:predicted acyltransferase